MLELSWRSEDAVVEVPEESGVEAMVLLLAAGGSVSVFFWHSGGSDSVTWVMVWFGGEVMIA
jgi:hypothetical protein